MDTNAFVLGEGKIFSAPTKFLVIQDDPISIPKNIRRINRGTFIYCNIDKIEFRVYEETAVAEDNGFRAENCLVDVSRLEIVDTGEMLLLPQGTVLCYRSVL